MRIRESDPLKFLPTGRERLYWRNIPLSERWVHLQKQYAESLAQVSGQMTLVAGSWPVYSGSRRLQGAYGKTISKALEESIENRESILAAKGDKNFIQVAEEGEPEFIHEAISPIICEGDVIGAVLLLNNDPKLKMGEVEQKLILSAAGFLGRQMEQ